MGALNERFDFDTVNTATAAMPEVSFVFIGPGDRIDQQLVARENVHVLGWRHFDDLPAYMRHADVGLIPFDSQGQAKLVNGVHPLKLTEYLASGLPVVARRWPELEQIASPALLYDDVAGFLAALRIALREPPDVDVGREFAHQADWSSRGDLLLGAIAQPPAAWGSH